MHRRLLAALATLLAVGLAFSPLASCSSDTREKAGDAVDSAKDDAAKAADTVQARTTAEALRVSLKGNDTADKEGIRSVKAIQQAAEDLPGDPKVTGIEDGDGDGLDDDGKVQVTQDGKDACLSLSETGEDTTVDGGPC